MKTAIALLLSLCLASALLAQTDAKARSQWWIKNHRQAEAWRNPGIAVARSVLRKLWQASLPNGIRQPRLIVLSRAAEKWSDSWAFALPDGSIVLVESLLDLVFEQGSAAETSDRATLAFILSHELAHLIHRDHARLGISLLFQPLPGQQEADSVREAEFDADRRGMLILTAAGYDPRAVFRHEGENFLIEYERKVRKRIRIVGEAQTGSHPVVSSRSSELRRRLAEFAGTVDRFRQGVDRYREGRFEEAAESFRNFLAVFPGREVHNNIAAASLNAAVWQTGGCSGIAYRLHPSFVLELETLAAKLVYERSRERACRRGETYRRALQSAKRHLQLALRKDPHYWPAEINLSSLFLLEGDTAAASRLLEGLEVPEGAGEYLANNRLLADFLADPQQPRPTPLPSSRQPLPPGRNTRIDSNRETIRNWLASQGRDRKGGPTVEVHFVE